VVQWCSGAMRGCQCVVKCRRVESRLPKDSGSLLIVATRSALPRRPDQPVSQSPSPSVALAVTDSPTDSHSLPLTSPSHDQDPLVSLGHTTHSTAASSTLRPLSPCQSARPFQKFTHAVATRCPSLALPPRQPPNRPTAAAVTTNHSVAALNCRTRHAPRMPLRPARPVPGTCPRRTASLSLKPQ
jgi:hypothetical protein